MNYIRNSTLTLFALSLAIATVPDISFVRAQTRQTPSPSPAINLSVGGEVKRPLQLTAADFSKLPRRTVRVSDNGTEAVFEGVLLVEVLKLAGLEFGETLRGKRLETYLLVEAADGYKAVFALPELDPAFTDKVVLLADKRDGKPLVGEEGRLRIVVPDERRHARWVRQVVSLIVRRA